MHAQPGSPALSGTCKRPPLHIRYLCPALPVSGSTHAASTVRLALRHSRSGGPSAAVISGTNHSISCPYQPRLSLQCTRPCPSGTTSAGLWWRYRSGRRNPALTAASFLKIMPLRRILSAHPQMAPERCTFQLPQLPEYLLTKSQNQKITAYFVALSLPEFPDPQQVN